jgi:adenine-specific DNA-methyltransferase
MAQLQFKGKPFVQNYHMLVKYRQLIPRKDKSLTKEVSLKDNLILHGDNLAALKALMPQYAGKVKCIYIDPPYNTGKEGWIYNDNVTSPMMQEWLGKVVDRDDLTRHDKWLCMMMPRLKLLKELLRDDGVIFVSIDDNEVHHLRMLMDEIFGEENFIVELVWERKRGKDNSAEFFSKGHEYVVGYAYSKEHASISRLEIEEGTKEAYRNPSKDLRGPYRLLGAWARGTQGGCEFAFKAKTGKQFSKRLWLVSEETMARMDAEDRLVYVGDKIYRKLFLSEHKGSVPDTVWGDVSNAANAADEMKLIFGGQEFETPKPTPLIRRILEISTSENDVILDSFAGSGTTAHAVLALNKEDGGNRRFILVESEDYADKITAERVRRVIKGVPGAKDESLRKGLGGSFSYFDLGEPIDVDRLLTGKNLPSYKDLARYLFYTATGEEFNEKALDPAKNYVGESKTHAIHLFYEPSLDKLKNLALTLDDARRLKAPKDKRLMVFAPTKYLDPEYLEQYRIDFVQLPYEIYKAFG